MQREILFYTELQVASYLLLVLLGNDLESEIVEAIGVVEGCSAHGAEYMTGGTLVST